MRFGTRAGNEIRILAEDARCRCTGKKLTSMERCPICNFDDDGEWCVPEMCDEFCEIDPFDMDVTLFADREEGNA